MDVFVCAEEQTIAQKWGNVIAKACCDDFYFAMGLKTGATVYFGSAKVNGDWVHLNSVNTSGGWAGLNGTQLLDNRDREFDRGMDVHISAIAWVADAPHGS